MSRNQKWLWVLLFAAALLPACDRIEERGTRGPVLDFQGSIDAVPLTYGRLVAVSEAGNRRPNVALWFESDDRTLRAVRVNTATGTMSKQVIIVPRD